jgi:hypothetical protein
MNYNYNTGNTLFGFGVGLATSLFILLASVLYAKGVDTRSIPYCVDVISLDTN